MGIYRLAKRFLDIIDVTTYTLTDSAFIQIHVDLAYVVSVKVTISDV